MYYVRSNESSEVNRMADIARCETIRACLQEPSLES